MRLRKQPGRPIMFEREENGAVGYVPEYWEAVSRGPVPYYRPLKVSTAKVRYEGPVSLEVAGDEAPQVSAETGMPATYAEAEDGFDVRKVMTDRLMREEARLFLTGERNMSLYDEEEKPAPPRVAALREKLTAKRAENARKPLYVAVVTRGLNISGSLIPSAGRPSGYGGDWASFVSRDKQGAIREAMDAVRKWEKTAFAKYVVLVGTLTEEARQPEPTFETYDIQTGLKTGGTTLKDFI